MAEHTWIHIGFEGQRCVRCGKLASDFGVEMNSQAFLPCEGGAFAALGQAPFSQTAPVGVDIQGLYLQRLDAALAEKDREIAEWRAAAAQHLAERNNLVDECIRYVERISDLEAKLAPAAFTASDLPNPPRRPDGTLAPAPKPLPALKPAGDPRRVGG